jgi:predicted AAA+ superfamily ATPase
VSRAFERPLVAEIEKRLARPPALIQVVVGPRQVGKTTAVRSVAARWRGPVHFAAADLPLPPGPEWIESHWALARRQLGKQPVLLVLDEVQKVTGWSEIVKALWDDDRAKRRRLQVVLLGSSALLISHGAGESLAGRFMLHRFPHWSYDECRQAFGWDLDKWIFFGGYPGAVKLCEDEPVWRAYIADSLVETVLARDVLAMQTIAKPALLRHLFALAASFPAQILSYNKMLGQLQDAGNTTTLAHYLRLLSTAFLVSGLERYSAGRARSRGSSPKLVCWNNALVTALGLRSFSDTRNDPTLWGRLVENAVGAHFVNHLGGAAFWVGYWRERDHEVDYVITSGQTTWAVEVKSGRPQRLDGLAAFRRRHPRSVPLILGSGGMPLDEFLASDPRELLPALV